jgi:hypothetical protein
MDTRELRLGNLVHLMSGEPIKMEIKDIDYTVSTVDFASIELMRGSPFDPHNACNPFRVHCTQVVPIPLNEEWLVKLGFEITTRHGNFIGLFNGEHNIELYNDGSIWFIIGENNGVYIKSVHQIQNLIFALTGKELDFSLALRGNK